MSTKGAAEMLASLADNELEEPVRRSSQTGHARRVSVHDNNRRSKHIPKSMPRHQLVPFISMMVSPSPILN